MQIQHQDIVELMLESFIPYEPIAVGSGLTDENGKAIREGSSISYIQTSLESNMSIAAVDKTTNRIVGEQEFNDFSVHIQ